MTEFYTGVGSRNVTDKGFQDCKQIAEAMSKKLIVLRSGGATGCDTAFELGAGSNHNVYLPWNNFNGRSDENGVYVNSKTLYTHKEAEYIASIHHPAWDKCSPAAKLLHTRNVFQVLGFELNNPSQVLVCWAEPDKRTRVKGGTATAVAIAYAHGVPVYNIWLEKDHNEIKEILGLTRQ